MRRTVIEQKRSRLIFLSRAARSADAIENPKIFEWIPGACQGTTKNWELNESVCRSEGKSRSLPPTFSLAPARMNAADLCKGPGPGVCSVFLFFVHQHAWM